MNPTTNDGGPAFPLAETHRLADSLPWTRGLSLRDYFAAAALTGLIAKNGVVDYKCTTGKDGIDATLRGFADFEAEFTEKEMSGIAEAIAAYELADAMLAVRAKGGAQ